MVKNIGMLFDVVAEPRWTAWKPSLQRRTQHFRADFGRSGSTLPGMGRGLTVFVFVMLGLFALAVIAGGCGKREAMGERKAPGLEPYGEEEYERRVLTVEEVLKARCEHELTIECAECRYEVGVVKVDPCLVAQAGVGATSLIQTIKAARQKVTTSIRITGELAVNGNAAVHVSPRISGTIRTVNVDIGAKAGKDDILFTVDSVELGEALSDYERNVAMTGLSEKSFRREKALYEQKVGSESEMIEAQMRFEEYQASLKASEQRLHVFGLSGEDIAAAVLANYASLGRSLAVRAPISGTIIGKHAVTGEYAEPGRDVMVLADLTTAWVWGGVYERDLAVVLACMAGGVIPVEITVSAFPGRIFTGRLDYVANIMDETTRTVKVRTIIDNKEELLRPGMFCEVRLLLTADEAVMAIPKEALLSDEGVDFIFTHMKDNYYLRRNVGKGRVFDDSVEILEGLEPGVILVAKGAFLLKSDVLRSKMGAGCAD